MPHILIEYSANLRDSVAFPEFLLTLREAALKTGVFPLGGIRTRAAARAHYRIADGDPAYAFVHVVLRIAAGRDAATRERAGQHVFDALAATLAPAMETRGLALSFELQEITPAWSARLNNIHERLAARSPGR